MTYISVSAVNDLLFRLWDPIPVNYNENLSDEYEPFAIPIVRLLRGDASIDDIADALARFETELHAETSDLRRRQVAEALLNLRRKH